eukprot:gene2719-3144_t
MYRNDFDPQSPTRSPHGNKVQQVKIDLQGHESPASSNASSTLSSASSSTFASGNRSPAESIIGYVHNLSNLKTSASNNPYFDLTLQTPDKTYRTACYSPEKHQIMKRTSERASPVKIGKFHFQMNNITQREEIILNKRSKLDDAPEQDITFEYDQSLKKKDAIKVTVEDAKSLSVPADPVKILGRITFTGKQENLHSKGRALAKQECILTDETGSIRFVLWENDVSVIASGEAYRVENTVIKRLNDQNYVSLNCESKVHELENMTITKKDDVSSLPQATTKSALCPAKGIQNFKKMLTCDSHRLHKQNKTLQPLPNRKTTYHKRRQNTYIEQTIRTNFEVLIREQILFM